MKYTMRGLRGTHDQVSHIAFHRHIPATPSDGTDRRKGREREKGRERGKQIRKKAKSY